LDETAVCLASSISLSVSLARARLTFVVTSVALQVMYTLIRATVVAANLVLRGKGVVRVFAVW